MIRYLGKYIIVFVDAILLYSRMEEDHEKHLVLVLQLLKEHKNYVNLSKCNFFQSQIH